MDATTSCLATVHPNTAVVIPIESSWFNVFNFVLFDIFLASFVFYLTGDIAGLSNSSSAVQQTRNRISAYNPPLVGVGLTCTRRNVYRALALVRGAVMIIVLATNFLIEGSSCAVVQTKTARVLVPGPVDLKARAGDLRQLGLRRLGCQGRNGTLTYYGELREDLGCLLDENLMTVPPVYFGTTFVNRSINFNQPCELAPRAPEDIIRRFSCPGLGTIACRISLNGRLDPERCQAIVKLPDENGNELGHFCSGHAVFPGTKDYKIAENRNAECRLAINVNTTDTTWTTFIFATASSLKDTIDIVYGAQFEAMKVNFTDPSNIQRVSEVDHAWFALLGVTLLILVCLLSIDLFLRSKGHVPVANSEYGLGSLIARIDLDNDTSTNSNNRPPVPIGPIDNTWPDNDQTPTPTTPLLYIQNRGGVLRARGGS